MKRQLLTAAILATLSTATFATGSHQPPAPANVTGAAVNAQICDVVTTSAMSKGLGTSTSNAGMASGATATAGATSGSIAGSTSVYNNGFANNVSTGAGVGSASAAGVASADAASSFKTVVPGVGSVQMAGATSADSAVKVQAGKNQTGTGLAATATTYSGTGSLVKAADGTLIATVADVKAAQSVTDTTGTGQAWTNGSVKVSGVAVGSTGVVVAPKNCFTSHDVHGNPRTECK